MKWTDNSGKQIPDEDIHKTARMILLSWDSEKEYYSQWYEKVFGHGENFCSCNPRARESKECYEIIHQEKCKQKNLLIKKKKCKADLQ